VGRPARAAPGAASAAPGDLYKLPSPHYLFQPHMSRALPGSGNRSCARGLRPADPSGPDRTPERTTERTPETTPRTDYPPHGRGKSRDSPRQSCRLPLDGAGKQRSEQLDCLRLLGRAQELDPDRAEPNHAIIDCRRPQRLHRAAASSVRVGISHSVATRRPRSLRKRTRQPRPRARTRESIPPSKECASRPPKRTSCREDLRARYTCRRAHYDRCAVKFRNEHELLIHLGSGARPRASSSIFTSTTKGVSTRQDPTRNTRSLAGCSGR